VKYWREKGFPLPTLTQAEIFHEYHRLEKLDPQAILRKGTLTFSSVGLRLANSFHPQMWSVRLHDHAKSPLDHFADDIVLRKTLARAMRFWPGRRCWNAQCVRSAFRVYSAGRVANFRPSVARTLVSLFSPRDGTVLDFSAGFGGRLLGTISLPRYYIGIDPALDQYRGLCALWSALRERAAGKARIYRQRAESLLPKLSDSSVDMVLSSPPYFGQERYGTSPTQSAVRYRSYSDWKSGFLYEVLTECARVLKPGGHLVINVKDTRQHEIASDTSAFLGSILERVGVFQLAMAARPKQRAALAQMSGYEPVFIFRKKGIQPKRAYARALTKSSGISL